MLTFLSFLGALLLVGIAMILVCGILGLFGVATTLVYVIVRFGLGLIAIAFGVWLIMKLLSNK